MSKKITESATGTQQENSTFENEVKQVINKKSEIMENKEMLNNKSLGMDDCSIIDSIMTDIGEFKYFSNGTVLNNTMMITNVPKDSFYSLVEICLSLCFDYGYIIGDYEDIVKFYNEEHCLHECLLITNS